MDPNLPPFPPILLVIICAIILGFILTALRVHVLITFGIILVLAGIVYSNKKFLLWDITYTNAMRGLKTDEETYRETALPWNRTFGWIMIIIGVFLLFLGFYATSQGIR